METIFATATAPIKSGVAIIRISGDKAGDCIEILTGKGNLPPRIACLHKLYNPGTKELIDEALLLWFPSPRSFTGEDTLELHVHGSRAVISETLEILAGIPDLRLAEPGEFSKRAFDNGKMDLTEAEGLADLIDAETRMQAKQALRQKQGELKDLYAKWRKSIISILAKIEAYIDFPDEEIPDSVTGQVTQSVFELTNSINKHLNDNKRGEKIRNGLHAVIVGAPNVGKSSLINALARRDVAIVSDIAGTTRDIIEVHLDLAGYPVILADTAGLRNDAQDIEKEGIKRALIRVEDADIKIAVFDACNFPKLEKTTLNLIDNNTIVIINKIDLIKNRQIPKELERLLPIKMSVTNKDGVDKLILQLEKFAEKELGLSEDPVITRQRHRSMLKNSVISLNKFTLDDELELSAENLRQAAVSLGRITGHIDVEEILDDIFSNFCIGK